MSDVAVERVSDAATAIERIESGRFDCVVATAILPQIDGVALLRRVRGRSPDTARVLLLGGDQLRALNRAHAARITHVLARDVETDEELAGRIRRIVADREVSDDLDQHSRLRSAITDALPDVWAATTRSDVERVVCERLVETGLFSVAWVSDFDPRTGTLSPRTAVGIDVASLASRPFIGDATPETVEVHTAEDGPQSTTVAISLGRGERYYGTCQLSTGRAVRPAECALLATLGTLLTEAIDSIATGTDVSTEVEMFSGILAHELRNYLQIVHSYLHCAEEDHDEDAFRNVRIALERIEQLTDEAALIAHRSIRSDDVSERDLGVSASMAWERVGGPTASLTVVDSKPIEAHHSLLEVLLENLFRNSSEHADGAEIRVGTLDDGFYVEDSGPGIPGSDRDQVFEWGFTTDENSTGIGLVIVKQIVDAHGWEIGVTESRDGGARFEITVD